MAGKRANGEGNLRQRKDGKWEIRITTGRDPGTGKLIRRSLYFDTQQEARKKLNASACAVDDGTYLDPTTMTIKQWLTIWTAEYLGSIKPSTSDLYKRYVRTHLTPTLGAIRLQALTAPAIQRIYNQKLNDGISPKTIKNVHGVLHKALEQAVKVGFLRVNPSSACDLPRVSKPDIHPLEGEQVRRFLERIENSKYKNLFTIALLTGLRESELLGLTWSAIDFHTGELAVDKQLQRRKPEGGDVSYAFAPLKNDKPRRIKPGKVAMECLHQQRKAQLEQKLVLGNLWSNPLDLVFTHEDGRHVAPNSVIHALDKIKRAIGRPDFRFHDIRHTYATLAIQNGVDIKTVSESLGHATVAFTLDVYGHVTSAMQEAAADIMDAYIKTQF